MTQPTAASRPFVYLATPCYGALVHTVYMNAVIRLIGACAAQGVGLHVDLMGGDALITRARSRLTAQFLAHPQATHLLFCDADIGFAPENVFRLLEADKEMIGAVYPLKTIDWDKARKAMQRGVADVQASALGYVVRFLPNANNSVEVNDGFAQVAYAGTGFLMIKRQAVQRIVDAYPETRARMGDMADPLATEAAMIFDTMIEPETRQYLSEDYAFCRRWRDLGGEIWADFQARLTHVGPAAYSGSLLQALTDA